MKKLLCLMLLCAGQFASAANDYYVSTVGDDSNDGSQAHPWATIQHAVNSNTATPIGPSGTVIHVAAGSYRISAMGVTADPLCSGFCDLYHIFIGKGGLSDTRRLVLQCDLQYQCLISPSDNTVKEGLVNVGICCTSPNPGGSYVDVVGFDITGTKTADATHTTQAGIELLGAYSRAIGNYIHHIMKNDWDGPYGVYEGFSSTTTGCQDACPSNSLPQSHGQQVIGNVIVDVGIPAGSGFRIANVGIYAAAPDELIENNIIYNNPAVVTVQACITANHWGLHSVISNNTINCGDNGGAVHIYMNDSPFDGNVPVSTNTYNNNIVIHSTANGYAFREHGTYGGPLMFGSNACDTPSCFVASGSLVGTFTGTITNINPATFFAGYNPNNQYPKVTVNGFTINPGGTDYTLKSGDAAIGTTVCVSGGITPCHPNTDFTRRAVSNQPPIGAYAFDLTSAPSAPSNLTATVR